MNCIVWSYGVCVVFSAIRMSTICSHFDGKKSSGKHGHWGQLARWMGYINIIMDADILLYAWKRNNNGV